jgi:undecaprenyl-phosphate 4-deoxy-4-formamido-L-arabinose transferase
MRAAADAPDVAPGPELSIVVPVYRSAECLDALATAVERALEPLEIEYELVLVNDGSPDNSWDVVRRLCRKNPQTVGVDLRRNFGQDNAILAGLRLARGRFVAIMDDDLQHDPRDLPALLAKIQEGADVVYADFRVKHHKLWKNLGSWFNGKVAEWVIDKPRGVYLSPYKLMRKEVAELICQNEVPEPYVDRLLFQVTSRFAQVSVDHYPRFAGKSGYTVWKSMAVWARLITASVRPVRLVTWCGLALGAAGGILAAIVVVYRLLHPEQFVLAVAGWASLMVALLFIGGVQMVFLGVLGEYVGRTHTTVARKPQAVVREVLNARAPKAAASPVPAEAERKRVGCGR